MSRKPATEGTDSNSSDEGSGVSFNKAKKGPQDVNSLRGKAVAQWSVADVATFLQAIRLGEYVASFVREALTGEELIALGDGDLRELGVAKFGPRKKLLSRIKLLAEKGSRGFDEALGSETSEESADSETATVKVVAVFKKQKAELTVKSSISLKELQKELLKAFGSSVKLRMRDDDDDLIPITTDKQLWAALSSGPVVRFTCTKVVKVKSNDKSDSSKSSEASASAAEYSAMDNLSDAMIVINEDGRMLYANKQVTVLLEFTNSEMIGQNVKMLMPDTYAKKHDGYLANYLATGVAKVIGKERTVMARTKGGKMIACVLAVSESKKGSTSRFVGVLKRAQAAVDSGKEGSIASMRSVMDLLQEPAIVINEEGDVLVFNSAAAQLWGYTSKDVVGKKVDMLMPSPHRENHDYYLQRYVATNEKRVMGSSRDVAVELSSKKIVPMNLALSEQQTEQGRVFIGMMRLIKEAASKNKKTETVMQVARKMIMPVDIPAVVINEKGLVQAFNTAAEKFFGYSAVDVLSRNVSMLMNAADAAKHDEYLANYLKTKVAKVIGKERKVLAAIKGGKEVEVMLSISEVEDERGAKIFTGLLYPPETRHRYQMRRPK